MPHERAFELRDVDGSFSVVRPLGLHSCEVLLSNLHSAGDILNKPGLFPWKEAALDKGERTVISPHELHALEDESDQETLSDPPIFDGRPDDEDFVRETHELIEARSHPSPVPWTLRSREPDACLTDADRVVLAQRLLIHYLVRHEKPRGANRRVEVCRCPCNSPRHNPALSPIHAIVYSVVRRRQPGLAWAQRAVAKAVMALSKKEESIPSAVAA